MLNLFQLRFTQLSETVDVLCSTPVTVGATLKWKIAAASVPACQTGKIAMIETFFPLKPEGVFSLLYLPGNRQKTGLTANRFLQLQPHDESGLAHLPLLLLH